MQIPARRLDRCASMKREKRGFVPGDGAGPDEADEAGDAKRRKVPALAHVIVEALKMNSLQKLCSSLEPVLRRVVSEEVERALAKMGHAGLVGRSSPKQIEGGVGGRNLQLHFRSRMALPLFTGGKVEGEQGAPIHVVLLDSCTGHVVTSAPESSAKLDVIVLEGDFNNEDGEDWSRDDFEAHVVKEREGKRPLLNGELQVCLKEGVGTLGELTFTDNSSWIRSRKFRLGLRVASGSCDNVRIREAKTEAFTVKDHRGELYKKHFPPALKDEVWRLEKIGKDGSFHKRLNKSGIYTVEDFLRVVVRDPQRLRKILGSSMSNKMWEVLVEHAKTCVLSGKHYVYYADDVKSIGAIFNNIYEFTGLIAGGQYHSAESLTESQKVFADSLVKKSYENWFHVIEYDGKALVNFKQSKKVAAAHKESRQVSSNYMNSYDQQVVPRQQQLSVFPSHPDQQVVSSGILSGYHVNSVTPQHVPSNACVPHEVASFITQNQNHSNGFVHQAGAHSGMVLIPPPPQEASSGYPPSGHHVQSESLSSGDEWSHHRDNRAIEEYFSEEEIRMRSHEILGNEDMQHLLSAFTMGGSGGVAATSAPEDGFGFSSYMPSPCMNFNFYEEEHARPSFRPCAGWLKIKAAMRWGIFIRKKAAERRAQLIELDD